MYLLDLKRNFPDVQVILFFRGSDLADLILGNGEVRILVWLLVFVALGVSRGHELRLLLFHAPG